MKKLILILTDNEKVSKETLLSIGDNKYQIISDVNDIPSVDLKDYTHVILLPDGSILEKNYETFIQTYYKDDAVLLPMVMLNSKETTGVLNSCVWNLNINQEPGVLSEELSKQQIDLTLIGALIPVSFIKPHYFYNEIKYYKQNYFLNAITYDNKKVIGIPKIAVITNYDLLFSDAPQDEKLEDFKKAKKVTGEKLLRIVKKDNE